MVFPFSGVRTQDVVINKAITPNQPGIQQAEGEQTCTDLEADFHCSFIKAALQSFIKDYRQRPSLKNRWPTDVGAMQIEAVSLCCMPARRLFWTSNYDNC